MRKTTFILIKPVTSQRRASIGFAFAPCQQWFESLGFFLLWAIALAQTAQCQNVTPATIAPEQLAFLQASHPWQNSFLGISVSLSSDTLLVGAYGEKSGATGVNSSSAGPSSSFAGAAYIFRRQGEHWTQEAYLKPSTNQEFGQFGISCSLGQDTAIVGSSELLDKGSAYVFVRKGKTWTEQVRLRPRPAAHHDQFGAAVALDQQTLVVGAPEDRSLGRGVDGDPADNGDISVGAAYVFERTANGWQQQAYLKPSNSRGGFRFGCSVAVSGETIVVGAWGENSGELGVKSDLGKAPNGQWTEGAAYVFVRTNGHWSQQARLKVCNTHPGQRFGEAVSLSGDTIAVRAEYESNDSVGLKANPRENQRWISGAVHVFLRTEGQWTQQACLGALDPYLRAHFGESLVVCGDTLLVGSRIFHGGAACVFSRVQGMWRETARLSPARLNPEDNFGTSLAVSGGLVAVGAQGVAAERTISAGQRLSLEHAGAAYIFRLPPQ